MIFLRSTRSQSFLLGFHCTKIGHAYLKNSCNVMIPFLGMRASSTVRSTFTWTGIGRFWLSAVILSFGVSFTSNSMFIPMSIQFLAKCHDIRPEYLQLLVFQPPQAGSQSNQIALEFSAKNLCHLLGLLCFSLPSLAII